MINKYFLAKMNIPAYLKKFLYGGIEIEGIPPIIFQGNGKNLIDYRIDGASGGVGERTNNLCESFTSTMSTIQYANALLIKTNFQESTTYVISFKLTEGCKVYANETIFTQSIRLVGQGQNSTINVTLTTLSDLSNAQMLNNFYRVFKNAITQENIPVFYDVQIIQGNNEPLNYEPYGYKVPVVISGKNLFDEIYTNIVTGWDVKYKSIFVGEGTFTLSTTCPKQDDSSATNLFFLSGNVSTGANSATNGVYNNHPVTVTSLNGYVTIGYRAQSYDPRNYTTMLNEGTTALPYEPYHEPITTNIYLDEPIEENESISLSDTNTNIPTIRGTNVLTVDTTVQPSNVYIKVGGG